MIRRTIDVEQGSPEWKAARLGIPTASQFHRLITAKTRKPSAQAKGYMHELLAEWLLGEPMGADPSAYMQRGSAMELEAVRWYEFSRDCETRKVGLCVLDDSAGEPICGCSPDRLVGDTGGLEIKCLSAPAHVAAILGADADEYIAQVQGCLWITGREWWDIVRYHPRLPSVCLRIFRDDEYAIVLSDAVASLAADMREAKSQLAQIKESLA